MEYVRFTVKHFAVNLLSEEKEDAAHEIHEKTFLYVSCVPWAKNVFNESCFKEIT